MAALAQALAQVRGHRDVQAAVEAVQRSGHGEVRVIVQAGRVLDVLQQTRRRIAPARPESPP